MRTAPVLWTILLGVVLAGVAWTAQADAAATEPITMTITSDPPDGWMREGWGCLAFTFTNNTDTPARIVGWTAHWEAKGEAVDLSDGEDDGIARDDEKVDLPPGQEVKVDRVGWLAPKALDAAAPEAPVWKGTFTIEQGDKTTELAWQYAVPEAVLPEPLVEMKGEYIGYALMKSRYEGFKSKERLLTWLNESYKAMWDLTGHRPYNGDYVLIRESPSHPWYAYAGNPIVMSSRSLKGFVEDIDAGFMPFGWTHELGHDFDDVIGEWYIWDGGSCEWQANWKLNYAYEVMPDQDYKAKWGGSDSAGFNPPGDEVVVSGPQFMDSFFLFFGDPYLADPNRTWDTMQSDDLHSFFLRIKDQYGWEPFKQWYRTYVRFEELGLAKPETAEDKINLIAAILSHTTGVDLVPVFQKWRMPVTEQRVAEMNKRYPIANLDEAVRPASAEAAADLIKLTVERVQKDGWMRSGWGQIRYTFENTGTLPATITAWNARWETNGKPYVPESDEGPASDEDVMVVPAGESAVVTKLGWLDPAVVDAAAPNAPVWMGTFTVQMADYRLEMPWRIEVPAAVIKEKLVRVEGKHMAYEITQTHHDALGKEGNERLIALLDHAYEAMQDLTGYIPYDGKIITIIESPPHPYYAYAGNPIIMDTTYMDAFVESIKRGDLPFGWIHELGHDFDICDYVHPDWYALGLESQANIKVVYAYNTISDPYWKAEWGLDKGAMYPAPAEGIMLDGGECMDKQFLYARDDDMANPDQRWEDSFCEHVFLQRLARIYGWDVVKKYYRTAEIISRKGQPWPELDPPLIDRVRMFTAILCATTGVDLVPAVRRWRVPITHEEIKALQEQYGIVEAAASIVLPEPKSVTRPD
ncbi:MAG: hypothetical protein JW889_16940 [Verrucomicrobia bacterium]|nr:hypothetical protein [Verrucomicrobiota bacterium]